MIGNAAGFSGATANLSNVTAIGNGAVTTTANTQVFGNASITDTYFGSTTPASAVHVQSLNADSTQATVTGTTAGTAVWSQPERGTALKVAVVYLNGYENTTATAQIITLPASYATVAYVLTDGGACTGVTISGATVTLPVSMSATQTGLCEVRGY